MIPCQGLNAKRQIRVESSYESIISQNKYWAISTKSPKFPLCPWTETWIHLSHKRTLGIEEPESKFRKKGMQEDSYEKDKSSKARKVQKWHGSEEQMNTSFYHMLQSCGVWASSYLKTEVTNEIHLLASKELSWLENPGFHPPTLYYHQWLKVHIFSFWEIHIAGRIQ